MRRTTTASYLEGPETMRRRELVWGIVRDAPGPSYGHQAAITNLVAELTLHVRARGLGRVCVSPVDVIFDGPRSLVLQPDVVFVSAGRLGILRDRIRGIPDLVVEVLSRGTARRDRTQKLRWYRRYGVREYWLVDPGARAIEIVSFRPGRSARRSFSGSQTVVSAVLPDLELVVGSIFDR